MHELHNPFKHALKSGRLQLGLWHSLASPIVAEVIGDAGFDWILLDMEHAPNELPMVLAELQALRGSQSHPVVRPPWNDPVVIKRVMDAGAQSLLIPYVETEEEARRAVMAVRYPPDGFRGYAGQARASRYGKIKGYHAAANAEVCLLLQVETKLGLDNLDKIAAVEGVDGVFVGPGRPLGRARLSRPAEPSRGPQGHRRHDCAHRESRRRARHSDRRRRTRPALYRQGLPVRRGRHRHRHPVAGRRPACGEIQEPELRSMTPVGKPHVHTASAAMLEALQEAGVAYIFANFGSDHPALIEAIAEARSDGRPIPTVITCPNEMVAMTCAHGYAQLTGRAQAVVVHVDCGTQALGGAVHNAAKARIPTFVFAGLSPATQEGEAKGSRNEFIQWIQDVPDQRGIVRQYMKYDNELRSPHNVKQIVHRSLQLAQSDPKGPVYLVGAREVMEAETKSVAAEAADWPPIAPTPLAEAAVAGLVDAFQKAARPLVVTSYVGRNPAAVAELVRFCGRLGIGVLESVPSYVNYPHNDPLYQGNVWNHPFQNRALADSDFILVVDSDVPWIPTVSKPSDGAEVAIIDVDPLKPSTPLWSIKARQVYRADAATAFAQLNAHLDRVAIDTGAADRRRGHYAERHLERKAGLERLEQPGGEIITPEYLTACVRRQTGMDAIILNEGITNYPAICDHMAREKPGTMFASGGGSLGWTGGAAIGMKLAAPDKTFIALTGDGSYMFSQPSTVHWMARRYRTPFLQVVYNNRGWKAPRFSALAVHPHGFASRAKDLDLSFDPPPDYSGIAAAAGGAYARVVKRPQDVEAAVAEGMKAVREEGRAAVLDVWLSHL